IESIRRFDVETQRKVEDLNEVELTVLPVGEVPGEAMSAAAGQRGSRSETETDSSFLDALPAGSWGVLCELTELLDEAKAYLGRLDEAGGLFSVSSTMARLTQFPSVAIAAIAADGYDTTCHLRIESIERIRQGPRSEALAELESLVGRDEQVLIACHNEG